MALAFLRQDAIGTLSSSAESKPVSARPALRKFSKSKFSLLLSGNVIVWIIFAVSLLDIHVFSMDAIDAIPVSIPLKLTVSGIIYHEISPSALIGKEVYRVGDVVDGFTIVRIDRHQVEFEKNGKTVVKEVR